MPKRVIEPTAIGDDDGFPMVILPEQIYADNHPLVKRRPDLFVDAFDTSTVIDAPGRSVEQATAAPGEKRAR
jgi:hypothetical protein